MKKQTLERSLYMDTSATVFQINNWDRNLTLENPKLRTKKDPEIDQKWFSDMWRERNVAVISPMDPLGDFVK